MKPVKIGLIWKNNMDLNIIYQDKDILVVDKPAGVVVFDEGKNNGEPRRTMIQLLLEQFPELKNVGEAPRFGAVHRLDKDTSGVLLVAKTVEGLNFLQKQFIIRGVTKKYLALVIGDVKGDKGIIHTLMARSKSDPRKQKASWLQDLQPQGKREAISKYKVLQRFDLGTNFYTLLEVNIETGRKHQIRCHLAYIHHPIAGDSLYGFKDSPRPEGLERQFLHATYLKIKLPGGETKEFTSELPNDLQKILSQLKPQ